MFVVQISLLIVTFLSLVLRIVSLMQTIKEVNPHPCIAPCVNMWSVTFLLFFFLCHLLNVGACMCHMYRPGRPSGVDHTTPLKMLNFVLFHSVTCYTNSTVSRIHVNTTKLRDIMHTLIATCVILQSLECSMQFGCFFLWH